MIHGTGDQMLASSNGEMVASSIPGARLEMLDGVGHLFFWEQPERAAQLITEHVADRAGVATRQSRSAALSSRSSSCSSMHLR